MFFCKQKTAYEMRISDWSSDVCSSDLNPSEAKQRFVPEAARCEALFAKASADQMTPERAQQLAEAWRHRIRDDDGDNLIWDFVDAQQHEPGCDPEDALMDPDELLEDVERRGELGRIASADRKSTRLNSRH